MLAVVAELGAEASPSAFALASMLPLNVRVRCRLLRARSGAARFDLLRGAQDKVLEALLAHDFEGRSLDFSDFERQILNREVATINGFSSIFPGII